MELEDKDDREQIGGRSDIDCELDDCDSEDDDPDENKQQPPEMGGGV